MESRTATTTTTTSPPKLELCELGRPSLPGHESYSPYCLKVHRALKSAGLPYTSRHGSHPGAHRAVSKSGQVPVLLVDGQAIDDSTRILAHLAARQPTPVWAAVDPAVHAEALLWEELADTSLGGFVVAARWADDRNWAAVNASMFSDVPWFVRHVILPAARRRIVAGLVARDVWRAGPDACWRRFELLLDSLERRAPAAGYWLGDSLTVADLGLFAHLQNLRAPMTAWQRARVEACPALRAYLDRVDLATR